MEDPEIYIDTTEVIIEPELDHFNAKNADNTKKLTFIHIPKTGGTTIERLGQQNSATKFHWGLNKFYNRHKKAENSAQRIAEGTPTHKICTLYPGNSDCCCSPVWHVPLQCMVPNHMMAEPADFSEIVQMDWNASYKLDEEIYFAVVRNPYLRLISEYWWQFLDPITHGITRYLRAVKIDIDGNKLFCDEEIFNAWVRLRFTQNGLKQDGKNLRITSADLWLMNDPECHLVPQWKYIYDMEDNERLVTHLLHTENLTSEFNELMGLYGIDLSLNKNLTHNKHRTRQKDDYCEEVQIRNLGENELSRVQNAYRRDFELLGYDIDATDIYYE